jgi:BMFP domain-containing protein YqiC
VSNQQEFEAAYQRAREALAELAKQPPDVRRALEGVLVTEYNAAIKRMDDVAREEYQRISRELLAAIPKGI